jgi:hypothetical protein
VEARLNPSLKGKPLAVVQYNRWKGGMWVCEDVLEKCLFEIRLLRILLNCIMWRHWLIFIPPCYNDVSFPSASTVLHRYNSFELPWGYLPLTCGTLMMSKNAMPTSFLKIMQTL